MVSGPIGIVEFLTARLDEEKALAHEGPHVVWQLEHEGYGTSLHATDDHAKVWAERREPDGDTYWRFDDGDYRFKRHGETIATIRRVQVLGAAPARVAADQAVWRSLIEDYRIVLANNAIERANGADRVDTAARSLVAKALLLVLRRRASFYADHPDFKPEWRIDA